MSIEPIITVYVAELTPDPARITLVAGLAMSATALGPADARAARGGRGASRIRRSVAKKARKITPPAAKNVS
jgi:hypothetical protein